MYNILAFINTLFEKLQENSIISKKNKNIKVCLNYLEIISLQSTRCSTYLVLSNRLCGVCSDA